MAAQQGQFDQAKQRRFLEIESLYQLYRPTWRICSRQFLQEIELSFSVLFTNVDWLPIGVHTGAQANPSQHNRHTRIERYHCSGRIFAAAHRRDFFRT